MNDLRRLRLALDVAEATGLCPYCRDEPHQLAERGLVLGLRCEAVRHAIEDSRRNRAET